MLQTKLKSPELGNNVEQVEALIKRHDATAKLIEAQEQKLNSLKDFGNRLIDEKHFDSENIAATVDAVSQK